MSGAVIDDDAAICKMLHSTFRIICPDHNDCGAILFARCTADFEAGCFRTLDQKLGEILIAFANAGYGNLVDDLLPAERRMHHVKSRRTELEAASVVVKLEMFVVETELIARTKPPTDLRRQFVDQLFANIDVAESGTTEHPLQRTRYIDVDVRFG